MNLLISLRSEILKTKRTAALYFTLIGAAVVPLIFLLNAFTHGLPDDLGESNNGPLNSIFQIAAEVNGHAIFPLFIILLCTLLSQIEHRNNTWKQVFTSPATKAQIFIAKFINALLLALTFLVANHLFMWIVAVAIHFILPELNLLQQPLNATSVLINAANTCITVLAVCTIQFWLGLRFKNFLVPVAIGLVLWFVGTLMVMENKTSFVLYFPYSFAIFPFSNQFKASLTQVAWTSFGYAIFFLVFGFIDFKQKRMTA